MPTGVWEALEQRGIRAADPDLVADEVAHVLRRLDALLELVVVDDDVVEARLPRRDRGPAGNARASGRPRRSGSCAAACRPCCAGKSRGPLELPTWKDRRRENCAVACRTSEGTIFWSRKKMSGIRRSFISSSACTLFTPTGDLPANVSSGQMAESKARHAATASLVGNRAERGGRRAGFRGGRAGGGEDDDVGPIDDVREDVVERGVGGVAVVQVHVEDHALRRVVDQRAETERVVQPRPRPGAVVGDGVDGDERELVARRLGPRGERLAPVEQRFLEFIERAGELREQRKDGPQQRETAAASAPRRL